MRSAEELRRRDLARNGMEMTEADRQKARHDAITEDERESLDFLCDRIAPKADEIDQDDVEDTKPKDYRSSGYIPTGSVVTDVFRVKVQTFELKERQDARSKRVPEEDMPFRLTTTVAGVDYYLQEIRHVIRTKEDVHRLWPGKDMERIKILTIDPLDATLLDASSLDAGREDVETEGEESASDIETRLRPLRGESASVIDYIDELKRVEARLKTFYTSDGGQYRRHKWNMERARQEEFKAKAERLLNLVGGS
ncbi:hypothetical protein KI688_004311 [Linnemannia hyalina]|uniref:Uncharacterized protein n=1 Tax=Linnemannia hyalina TaxID=64524 RepID=A0A9P8BPR2_9FUNG|nr:hypothetical protein KI688_004311 [Linnemannia hyalina]